MPQPGFVWMRRRPATKEELAQLAADYDRIFKAADDLFKSVSPCQIRPHPTSRAGIECTRDRADKSFGRAGQTSYGGCCFGCPHLGPQGCTVQALACKLWACSVLYDKQPDLIKRLYALKDEALQLGVPAQIRMSKEQNFAILEKEGILEPDPQRNGCR